MPFVEIAAGVRLYYELTGPEDVCDSCCPEEEGARGAAPCECEDVRIGSEQDVSRKLEREVVSFALDSVWTVPTGVLVRDAGESAPRVVARVEREPSALALVRCTVLRL